MTTPIARTEINTKPVRDRVKIMLESLGYVKTDKVPYIMKTVWNV